MRIRRGLPLGLAVLLSACQPAARSKPEITIAAAANLTNVFERVGPAFEAETGIHPTFSFASTAQLAQQIENAAPFDVFTAADSEHVDALDRKGLLTAGSSAVYAVGVLAVWIPTTSVAKVSRIEDLTSSEVRVIAIAKPELAPYGKASVETRCSIWAFGSRSSPKWCTPENINMAKQFGTSRQCGRGYSRRIRWF